MLISLQDSMSTAVLLILTYHTWSAIKLPPHLVTPDNMLFLVIAPRSKAHTHLYGQVSVPAALGHVAKSEFEIPCFDSPE